MVEKCIIYTVYKEKNGIEWPVYLCYTDMDDKVRDFVNKMQEKSRERG